MLSGKPRTVIQESRIQVNLNNAPSCTPNALCKILATFVSPILIMDQSHYPFWAFFSITVPFLTVAIPCLLTTHTILTHIMSGQLSRLSVPPLHCLLNPPSPLQFSACLPAYHRCSPHRLVLDLRFHWLVPQYAWLQALPPPISSYRYQIILAKSHGSSLLPAPEWQPNEASNGLSWPSRFLSFWTNLSLHIAPPLPLSLPEILRTSSHPLEVLTI